MAKSEGDEETLLHTLMIHGLAEDWMEQVKSNVKMHILKKNNLQTMYTEEMKNMILEHNLRDFFKQENLKEFELVNLKDLPYVTR